MTPTDRNERQQRISRDVEDEVRFHLERKVERLVASGMSEVDARHEAERRFGDVAHIKERMTKMTRRREHRRRWSDGWDQLRQDVVYALRRLGRSPGFTAVTALTLTLGIGATTAVFSVVDGILFRALPFREPEELVAVWSDYTRRGGPEDEWPNFADLWDLRAQGRTWAGVGIFVSGGGTLTGLAGPAEFITGTTVNHDMFARVLEVEPAIGSGFRPEDDAPGAPRTVLLSHGFWMRMFGGDPSALGRTLTMNGQPYTVIGVMPRDFRPPFQPDAEVWTPLRMDISDHACGRGSACMRAIARLAPDASLESARADAASLSVRLAADYPDTNVGMSWNLQPLQSNLVADARGGLLTLLGAAGFVLLIACVNQASLLLARGAGRHPELAVRSAIGAGRGRILSQLMVESMVLALVGGALGIGAAYGLSALLIAFAPAATPRVDEVTMNGRVLAFAASVTVLAGLFFGILPALRGSRVRVYDALREGARGQSRPARVRARQALVVVQVALALVLLAGSGLLVRTLVNLRRVDLGFQPDGALTFRVTLPVARYQAGAPIGSFHDRFGARLSALPGVQSVGATSSLPLSNLDGACCDMGFTIDGQPVPPPTQPQAVWYRAVTPNYLATAQTKLVSGRGIEQGDDAQAPRVVVINEAFARRYFPNQDPIGQRLNFDDPTNPVWWSVVGVATNIKFFDLRNEERIALYLPHAQFNTRTAFYVLRSDRDPSALAAEVREVLAELDPELAATQVMPFTQRIGDALASERFVTMLLSLFAAAALTLAVVGLYGVVSHTVNASLREMGVRIALGASGSEVATLVVSRSLTLVAIGLAMGLAGAAGLTRFLESQLFGVEASDPTTLMVATAMLGSAALLASLLPARRAARVAPSEVLREE
jgi:predicted permease